MANQNQKGKTRAIRNNLKLKTMTIPVYASPKISHAFNEATMDMNLYKGVRMAEVMEAVYLQGKKDGNHEASARMQEVLDAIPRNRPGQPPKKKAKH